MGVRAFVGDVRHRSKHEQDCMSCPARRGGVRKGIGVGDTYPSEGAQTMRYHLSHADGNKEGEQASPWNRPNKDKTGQIYNASTVHEKTALL